MNTEDPIPKPTGPTRRYKWPWFVLLAFIAAVVLAVLWMTAEVRRQQSYRQSNSLDMPAGTNATH